jgi:hypothetical protein
MKTPDNVLLSMAELGDTDAQLALGHWTLNNVAGSEGMQQALQWFYIARSLGENAATEHISEAIVQLDEDALDDALEQIDEWFTKKIEAFYCGKSDFADPLTRWLTTDRRDQAHAPCNDKPRDEITCGQLIRVIGAT